MKKVIKMLIIAVLVVNGATATYSGVNMMVCPDGSSLNLSHDLLNLTPFENFFIPGLLLFLFNGVSSVSVFAAFYYNDANTVAVKVQGLTLLVFIIVQISLIRTIMPFHIVYAIGGCLIIGCAYLFERPFHRKHLPYGAIRNHNIATD